MTDRHTLYYIHFSFAFIIDHSFQREHRKPII